MLMVNHFLHTNSYKMPIFERSVTCRTFSSSCTHLLTRTEEKKLEDVFLVKIALILKIEFRTKNSHALASLVISDRRARLKNRLMN